MSIAKLTAIKRPAHWSVLPYHNGPETCGKQPLQPSQHFRGIWYPHGGPQPSGQLIPTQWSMANLAFPLRSPFSLSHFSCLLAGSPTVKIPQGWRLEKEADYMESFLREFRDRKGLRCQKDQKDGGFPHEREGVINASAW